MCDFWSKNVFVLVKLSSCEILHCHLCASYADFYLLKSRAGIRTSGSLDWLQRRLKAKERYNLTKQDFLSWPR